MKLEGVPGFVWSALAVGIYAMLQYLLPYVQGVQEWWAPVATAAILAVLKYLEVRREDSDEVHVMGERRSRWRRWLWG